MPAIYISKYNRFVDTVIDRINKILGKSYDPVRVKLQTGERKNNAKGKGKGKGKGKKGNKRKNGQKMSADRMRNKMGELQIARASNQITISSDMSRSSETATKEPSFVLISKTGTSSGEETTKNNQVMPAAEVRARPVKQTNKKNKRKNTVKAGNANNKNKNKTKQSNKNKQKRPRATLFGLSSIRRDGDVIVNMMSDHTTVKTNFILGPLTLRVEREVKTGARRELKSATATTEEMYGRLNLRIVHGGAATLHSIRVLQPKQVKVDSPDNHDKTREYIWRRSAHIASAVSQKLSSAVKLMLKPPPATSS